MTGASAAAGAVISELPAPDAGGKLEIPPDPLEVGHHAIRLQVAGNALQQGRLAAARRSQKDEAVGGVDLEPDPVGRGDQVFLGLVLEGDAVDIEDRVDGGRG